MARKVAAGAIKPKVPAKKITSKKVVKSVAKKACKKAAPIKMKSFTKKTKKDV
jgi:hypothetical protein